MQERKTPRYILVAPKRALRGLGFSMNPTILFPETSTRRAFLGRAATLTAGVLLARATSGVTFAASAGRKPNSVIDGVRIGAISYSYRSGPSSAQDILNA